MKRAPATTLASPSKERKVATRSRGTASGHSLGAVLDLGDDTAQAATSTTDGDPNDAVVSRSLPSTPKRLRLLPDDPVINSSPVSAPDGDKHVDIAGDNEDDHSNSNRLDSPEQVAFAGYPVHLQRRLAAMRAEANAKTGSFHISQVPMDLTYGRNARTFNMENFVVNNNNVPITVYVAGTIVSFAFLDHTQTPLSRTWICIRPLVPEDGEAASALVSAFSSPPLQTTASNYSTIIAGKWQLRYGASENSVPDKFQAVYLAKEGLRKRVPHDVGKLAKGDLVVLELRLRRRMERDTGNYIMAFQLRAVNVLAESTGEFDGDVVAVDW